MANTNKKYEPEFKRKIARLYLEGGQQLKVSTKNTIWVTVLCVSGPASTRKNAQTAHPQKKNWIHWRKSGA